MCGESFFPSINFHATQGSPPHVWGKPGNSPDSSKPMRITPTCVGKAIFPLNGKKDIEDHPHMCGESPCT